MIRRKNISLWLTILALVFILPGCESCKHGTGKKQNKKRHINKCTTCPEFH
ncbi:MAG: hypothetical protein FD123_1997 [Bacteroidetes bacterium]|nr:MAG: hypothetical protein FD123_1997 [Bacteroidota bacterium]